MSVAIKVRCTSCHSIAEVTDEAMGAQAKCPFCDAVFDVAVEEDVIAEPSPDAGNWMELGKLEPAVAFQLSWEILCANWLVLFISHLVFIGSVVAVDVAQSLATNVGLEGLRPLIQAVGLPVLIWVQIGLTKLTLEIARGKSSPVETIFSGAKFLPRIVVFYLVFLVLVAIGCIAFIVPGVYLLLRFWSGWYFIIDRDCRVSEAFQMASKYSEWNKIPSLQIGCLAFGLAMLGMLFFGIGFLLVFPLINMVWTIGYLMMTRQPIQRPIGEA